MRDRVSSVRVPLFDFLISEIHFLISGNLQLAKIGRSFFGYLEKKNDFRHIQWQCAWLFDISNPFSDIENSQFFCIIRDCFEYCHLNKPEPHVLFFSVKPMANQEFGGVLALVLLRYWEIKHIFWYWSGLILKWNQSRLVDFPTVNTFGFLLDRAWIWLDFPDFKHDFIKEVYRSDVCFAGRGPRTSDFHGDWKVCFIMQVWWMGYKKKKKYLH